MRSPIFECERVRQPEILREYHPKNRSETGRKYSIHEMQNAHSVAQINQYLFIYRFQAFIYTERDRDNGIGFHACNRTVNRFHSRVNMY